MTLQVPTTRLRRESLDSKAKELGVSALELTHVEIDRQVARQMPLSMSEKIKGVVIGMRDRSVIAVVSTEPSNPFIKDHVQFVTRGKFTVDLMLGDEKQIALARQYIYSDDLNAAALSWSDWYKRQKQAAANQAPSASPAVSVVPATPAAPPRSAPLPAGSARSMNPEQLDQMLTVTSPLGWLALLCCLGAIVGIVIWSVLGRLPTQVRGNGILLLKGGLSSVPALVSGSVLQVFVQDGEVVRRGDAIARIQPLSQDQTPASQDVLSPYGGRVVRTAVRAGMVVQTGDQLVTISPLEEDLEAVLFLPLDLGKKVAVDQFTQVTVSTVDRERYGYIMGKVREVSKYAVTPTEMKSILSDDNLVKLFLSGETPYQQAPIKVTIELDRSLDTQSHYHWSSEHGPPFQLSPATLCSAEILTGNQRPIDLALPFVLEKLGVEQ